MRPLLQSLTGLFAFLLAAVAVLAGVASADEPPEFRFARIFTDNMVLQQEMATPIWGWA